MKHISHKYRQLSATVKKIVDKIAAKKFNRKTGERAHIKSVTFQGTKGSYMAVGNPKGSWEFNPYGLTVFKR